MRSKQKPLFSYIPRRPLCAAALVVVLTVLAGTCFFPPQTQYPFTGKEPSSLQLEGTVESLVRQKDTYATEGEYLRILELHTPDPGGHKRYLKVRCYLAPEGPDPKIGQRVLLSGTPAAFRRATNPGEFDPAFYYGILGYDLRMKDCRILAASKAYSEYRQSLHLLRQELGSSLDECFPEKEAGILKTMLLGDKSSLDPEIRSLYQDNGIIHILAISGVHISLLGMALYRFLRKGLFMKRGTSALFSAVLMISYGIMTGLSISALRAIFMFLVRLLAELVGRTYDMINTMAMVALLVLLENPYYVCHSGFLLSFGAVMGLGLFLPVWKDLWTESLGRKVSRYLKKPWATAALGSTAISFVTLPVLLLTGYGFPAYSLLLNLLVIPLMSLVMADTLLVLLFLPLFPPAALYAGYPARWILGFYEFICNGTGALPGHLLLLGKPALWKVLLYYLMLLIFLLFSGKRKELRPGVGVRALFPIAALCILCFRSYGTLQITMLDVGQGDGFMIRNENGNCYLIDGGSTSKSQVGKYQILPYLKSQGVGKVTALCLSHLDDDHVNGAMELLELVNKGGVDIEQVILPEPLKEKMTQKMTDIVNVTTSKGIPVFFVRAGQSWEDHNMEMLCLNPDLQVASMDANEMSEVFLLTLREAGRTGEKGEKNIRFSMLLTGDVTGDAELRMIQRYRQLYMRDSLTVLKVAHHGSRYSTPEEVLQATNPALALISAGEANRYGHPHGELVERLTQNGIPFACTADRGAVTLTVTGDRVDTGYFADRK